MAIKIKMNNLNRFVNIKEKDILKRKKSKRKFVVGKTYNKQKVLYRGMQTDRVFVRTKDKLIKRYEVSYVVQSVDYPEESSYLTTHDSLDNSIFFKDGCLYKQEDLKRNNEHLVKYDYLVKNPYAKNYIKSNDVEKYSKYSDRANTGTVRFTCTYCHTDFKTSPRRLTEKGSTCPWCSNILSYPERFMKAYLESKGLGYTQEHKVPKNDRHNGGYWIDFIVPELKLAIEMDGEQHYNSEAKIRSMEEKLDSLVWGSPQYKKLISKLIKEEERQESLVKSHEAKLKYCKENNLTLVRIDARKSSYPYIAKNIEESILSNITEENKKCMSYYLSLYKGKELKTGLCCGYISKNYNTKLRNENIKVDNFNTSNLPIEKFMSENNFTSI